MPTDIIASYIKESMEELGKITGDIVPITGGLMHRMFRVKTESGVYAVK